MLGVCVSVGGVYSYLFSFKCYNPTLEYFEKQTASFEQPFNVAINLLLKKKYIPLKTSSNKLAELEKRP